ncbi:MAG: ABC transporter permease subunit [Saprospiraceae bacterium]|nr:ABC transporter permease subunit [Saprospiraceae bacterium]
MNYLLRRILLAVPTLLVVSLLVFGLSKSTPGDPVVNVFGEESYQTLDPIQQGEQYRKNAARLGYDRPVFYWTFTTAAYPDSLWHIFPLDRRERLLRLIGQTGNWNAVKTYDLRVSDLVKKAEIQSGSFKLRTELPLLISADDLVEIDSAVAHFKQLIATDTTAHAVTDEVTRLADAALRLHTQPTLRQLQIPTLYWHGFNNQYHRWLTGFLQGDLGLTRRKVSVWTDLQTGFYATLAINGLSILLAYLIAVPLGVEMARKKSRRFDRWTKRGLFFLHSMPVFWLGGLLVLLFTHTEWGREVLPSIYFELQDAWRPGQTTFGEWWQANASKCVLPVVILTLYALAVLAMQMRGGMLDTLGQDYIRTARAKGVNEENVYWSHALRNALFPIITVFASVLPGVFTGSLVVENMFGFPGVGTKTMEAYLGQDLPLLSAIIMVAAVLTIAGSLLADLLYAWTDPRVRFSQNKR